MESKAGKKVAGHRDADRAVRVDKAAKAAKEETSPAVQAAVKPRLVLQTAVRDKMVAKEETNPAPQVAVRHRPVRQTAARVAKEAIKADSLDS